MATEVQKERDRIAEAINRLMPTGMTPNEDSIFRLNAIKILIWDESIDVDEAFEMAKRDYQRWAKSIGS